MRWYFSAPIVMDIEAPVNGERIGAAFAVILELPAPEHGMKHYRAPFS